jgi:putative membrane-bound dehydrogenase-like protein
MKPTFRWSGVLGAWGIVLLAALALPADKPPLTGPATEKRFPPLRVPPRFRATLFACDPLISYPSVIALGPRPRSVFVAVDYMTGLGTRIVRRDEIRLVEDSDGDGYADRATVFATGFNSIQGLAYHDGTLYVMHAPFLTALRDTRGKGVADQRRDLLTGLGLTPEENPVRLHCANGVVAGHDGWLYLALGDHGCEVQRPEGDRLVLHGGGILRCRPDGRDLHVFATGLRNIYDVALDEELNVFVRDNENDGGDYMVRVCHSFFGADHGYPYLYYEHPDEALPPLADLGLGSSAGGLAYLETQFPPEYRGNLFFCEWGRSVVRYRPRRAGSGFAPLKEIEFARGADRDPYPFKPTDLVVERDGSLLVADWADGQRPMRGRGRIYRITCTDKEARSGPPLNLPRAAPLSQWVHRLDSASHHARCEAQAVIEGRGREGRRALQEALDRGRVGRRCRLHAVWILARAGAGERERLLALAGKDPDPGVQAQAVRAIADLADPVLVKHRLDAGPPHPTLSPKGGGEGRVRGNGDFATRLAGLARGKDPRVQLEVVIALGRLRWRGTPDWLRQTLTAPDAALAHAAMQTLRRLRDWPALLRLMDRPSTEPVRAIALRAAAGQAVPELVDGLIERLGREPDSLRRRQYADLLTRVYKKPGPWVYWGYRPPPRPANTVAWERTEAIARALDQVLSDRDLEVRLTVLKAMRREKIAASAATLGRWLPADHQGDRVAVILESLRGRPAGEVRRPLARVVRSRQHTSANRLAALQLLTAGLDPAGERLLLELAGSVEDGVVLAELLRSVGKRPRLDANALLLRKAGSPSAEVRAGAVEALAERQAAGAAEVVLGLLADQAGEVRRAAAEAAGKLAVKPAADRLLQLARDRDTAVRRASLEALRRLREPRSVPLAVAALGDQETELAALDCLGDLGGREQAGAVVDLARRHPAAEVLTRVVRMLTRWAEQAKLPETRGKLAEQVAAVQGASGALLRWRIRGPVSPALAPQVLEQVGSPRAASSRTDEAAQGWHTVLAGDTESPLQLGSGKAADGAAWFAYTDVLVPATTTVQFLAAGSGTLRVWLNGRPVYRRQRAAPFVLDSDRFPATLARGRNRILVQLASAKNPVSWHLRFRPVSSRAEHERLTQAALGRPGDAVRGRAVFFNREKSQCLKCHRLGAQGERIGPDLTGAGGRFSRVYLIESILEPSRTIAPSYQTVLVVLKNGRQLMGVKVAEGDKTLILADREGKTHELAKADVEEQRPQSQSTMPDGLEKRLTEQEFIDLIAFLAAEKGKRLP